MKPPPLPRDHHRDEEDAGRARLLGGKLRVPREWGSPKALKKIRGRWRDRASGRPRTWAGARRSRCGGRGRRRRAVGLRHGAPDDVREVCEGSAPAPRRSDARLRDASATTRSSSEGRHPHRKSERSVTCPGIGRHVLRNGPSGAPESPVTWPRNPPSCVPGIRNVGEAAECRVQETAKWGHYRARPSAFAQSAAILSSKRA